MKSCSLPFLFIGLCQAQTYEPIEKYGSLLYDLLEEYTTSSTVAIQPQDVTIYMYSSEVGGVFDVAQKAGYDKRAVIESCYSVGIKKIPINTVIMDALKQDMRDHCAHIRILTYVAIGHLVVSVIAVSYLIGFSILYFKFDRHVIRHYKASMGGLYIRTLK